MNRPELILFDAVGTLIEPDPSVSAVYQQIARDFGFEISRPELGVRFSGALSNARSARPFAEPGRTDEAAEVAFWRAVVFEVLHGVREGFLEAAFQRLWNHFAEASHWRLLPDAASTLHELLRRGYRIGIASNFDSRLIGICKELPPLNQIGDLFVSSRVGWVKPAAGFYQEIQRMVQIEPARILMVGDDFENDVAAPQRQGWQARWLAQSTSRSAGQITTLADLLTELPLTLLP